jgi:hypothetical protein
LLDILGITGFAPRPPPVAPPAGPPAGPPALIDGPLSRPYDSRQRMAKGWKPLTDAQIAILNQRWGPGHDYNNVDGVEWSYKREQQMGRGRKTYRKRVSRRKTKKHI